MARRLGLVALALWTALFSEAFAPFPAAGQLQQRVVAQLQQEHHSAAPGIGASEHATRLLTPADVEALSGARKWHVHQLVQLMAPETGACCIVSWSGADVIGWVDVIRKAPCVGRKVGSLAFEPLPAHGYICNLFVLEEWRRQGVARTLLIQAEQQVQRWGLNHMALTVEQHNTAAQLCYQSLDYVLRGSAQEGMLWKDLVPRNTPP